MNALLTAAHCGSVGVGMMGRTPRWGRSRRSGDGSWPGTTNRSDG